VGLDVGRGSDRMLGFVGSAAGAGLVHQGHREAVCRRSGPAVVGRRGKRPGVGWRRRGTCLKAAAEVPRDDVKAPAVSVSPKSNGGQPSGLSSTPRFGLSHFAEGLRQDMARRAPHYLDDWLCGFKVKSVSATLFLFFACFAPIVAFGGLTAVLTNGSLGVVEFILSAGAAGVTYAIFSGQPLTIIGPTGLTLAFTSALYNFCKVVNVAFLPAYAWTGIWTGGFLMLLALFNCSDVIRHCTRFTDDVFNSLISVTFVYEAAKSLIGNFAASGADKTRPFMALTVALGTFLMGRFFAEFRKSKYLRRSIRTFLSDFGPCIAIVTMSAFSCLPFVSAIGLESLRVPAAFALAGGRSLFVDLFALPVWARFAAALPAVLLTCLFFLDQNISVRVVNSSGHKLKKGDSYHLDIFILGVINTVLSLMGLPWMCAATVQSLNHIRALAYVNTVTDTNDSQPHEVITGVLETRLTGFLIHALVLSSFVLLPMLRLIPMAVISGLFLFLGRNMMTGNEFLRRIKLLFVDPRLYPENSPVRKLRPRTVHLYTALQLTCLGSLWALKSSPRLSLFFPTVIGLLMVIRSTLAERTFSKEALNVLDGDLDYSEETENSHEELYEKVLMAPSNGTEPKTTLASRVVSNYLAEKDAASN